MMLRQCHKCQSPSSSSSSLSSCCSHRLIELAACSSHAICRQCYCDTISSNSYSNTSSSSSGDDGGGYEISISCPLCPNRYDNNDNNNNDDNITSGNIVTIHGLKLSEAGCLRSFSNRLLDVQNRYDSYYEHFQRYNTVFIHIPKTAGTSFEYALFNTKNRSQHAKASYWRARVGPLWERSFKFAIVRHPFYRLVSGYTYWKNGALAGQEVDQPFVHRCRTEIDNLDKFVSYLLHVHRNNLWDERDIQGVDGTCPIQFRPQTWFLSEDDNSTTDNKLIKLDFIGRYEDLDRAYDIIKQSIHENNKKTNHIIDTKFSDLLPHTRASFHPFDLPHIFNDPVFVSRIMEIYKSDFEAFNYSVC